jgi:hypothetical protein
MKIFVQGDSLESHALRRRFQLQEETLTAISPEILIPNDWYDTPVPDSFVSLFYKDVFRADVPSHYFVRYWAGDWHPQTAVLIPIYGLMNENLGHEVITGCGIRFIPNPPEWMFENTGLTGMVQGMKNWQGFLSIGTKDSRSVCSLKRGVPGYGLFALMEGLKCRLGSFVADPLKHLFTEWWWYGGQIVTRFPYPYASSGDKVLVEGLGGAVERHFWSFAPTGVLKESFYTTYTAIGVATAFARKVGLGDEDVVTSDPSTVQNFLNQTCRSIHVPRKQHRTDFARVIGPAWGQIKNQLGG